MKKMIFTLMLGLSSLVQAQSYVHQVYVLNEGHFNYQTNTIVKPVTLGSYNPVTQVYKTIDSLGGMRFASDMVIDGDFLYVAADTKIFKYNKLTNQRVGTINLPGVRGLGVAQNRLIATRGEYLTTYPSYLHVYDATTLQLISAIDTVSGPKWASQDIVIDGTKAYIAVNNAYVIGHEKGFIGILNLNALTYGNEIDLGPNGKNPDNLMKTGNTLVTVNNKSWDGTSISRIQLAGNSIVTSTISSATTGCGTSCIRDGNIIYQLASATTLNEWNVLTMTNVGPLANLSLNYYEIAEDKINHLFYASNTNFLTFGKVFIYNQANVEVTHFDVGVSPGTIIFDVRSASTASMEELEHALSIYPNPSNGSITVKTASKGTLFVSTLVGQDVYSAPITNEATLDLGHVGAGTYLVRLSLENGISTTKKVVIQ
jgi:hypothetical protein